LAVYVTGGSAGHTFSSYDQVRQESHQRYKEHKDEPRRLGEAAEVIASKDVDEDDNEHPEPDTQPDENQHGPEDI
jgi:hypothetical protein